MPQSRVPTVSITNMGPRLSHLPPIKKPSCLPLTIPLPPQSSDPAQSQNLESRWLGQTVLTASMPHTLHQFGIHPRHLIPMFQMGFTQRCSVRSVHLHPPLALGAHHLSDLAPSHALVLTTQTMAYPLYGRTVVVFGCPRKYNIAMACKKIG